MFKIILLACFTLLSVVSAYWGPDLPPGPYCGTSRQCCTNRQDGCAHRILDTLCYCDEFCNRTRAHDDCCPDYQPVCMGIVPQPLIKPCQYGGRIYIPGQSVTQGCNKCTCTKDTQEVTTGTQTTHWECETDTCLISDEILNMFGVDRPGNTWRAHNYTQFQGKKLKDGLTYKLGTLPLDRYTIRMGPISYNDEGPYPARFDARTKWPRWISPIIDQGWCGSDWAVAVAGVASDRFAIQSNGAESLVLSPQLLLSCNVRGQRGCEGGHIDVAWNFVTNFGLVDEECFPYKAKVTQCPFRKEQSLLQSGCQVPVKQRTSRYHVGPTGRLNKEKDIMYDIMNSGPVQAVMTVYQDFFHYRDGIYRHSQYGDNSVKGLHSVRIVGWGEERGDKYWIVANSWGREWGEEGYFRIARGENESDIEGFVVMVFAEVTEAYQRK